MCVRFRAVDVGRRSFSHILYSPAQFNRSDGKRIRNDGGPAQPKCNWNRARHSIWQRSGAIARHVFARIHLRCRFPSWSPRYIHVPEVPLHDTVGFLHRLGEIPSRRPVSENVALLPAVLSTRLSGYSAKPDRNAKTLPYRARGRFSTSPPPHGMGKGRRTAPPTLIRTHILSDKPRLFARCRPAFLYG